MKRINLETVNPSIRDIYNSRLDLKLPLHASARHVNYVISFVLILVGIAFRILPHPPNVAPITALALFGGATLSKKNALIIPLITMILSDLFIGMHDTVAFTWGSFLLISLIGYRTLRNKNTALKLFGATLSSSLLFYIVTNFGVWLQGTMYPMTLSGLLQSYIMAIPFYRNTMIGDVFFTTTLFGVYYVLVKVFQTAMVQRLLPFSIHTND